MRLNFSRWKILYNKTMLDINYIRENTEKVKEKIQQKNADGSLVDRVLELDSTRRDLIKQADSLREERNKVAKERTDENVTRGREIKEQLKKIEPELAKIEEEYKKVLYSIPNLSADDVPEGGEDDFELVREHGKPTKFSFVPKDHLEIGEKLGIVDVKRAAKVSGSRFGYLKGDAVLLEFALVQFAMSRLVKDGFIPILPPTLIKQEITEQLGYWHGGGNENYYLVSDFDESDPDGKRELPLYLVGTGEHSVVPMHADETFSAKELPKKYAAFSSCYRRESGSYGKDVRGILRVHQFDKVEMIKYVKPEDAEEELEDMVKTAEGLMQELGLPYRVVKLAAGDIGFPTAKTYDIETWMPGQDKYRETHSISTTTDYQARRLNIKYEFEQKPQFVHILNGTAFSGRTIIAILENFQQEDGSVVVPEVLRPYMGKDKITP